MSDRIMEWLDESRRLADQATDGPWEADLIQEKWPTAWAAYEEAL